VNRYKIPSHKIASEVDRVNKVLLGLLLGTVLGAIDGASSWFTPAVRAQLVGIVIGSTVKGLIAGVAIGFFARKVHSLVLGILFGLAVGFLLALLIARLQHGYYFEIILPGSIVGMIVGYATQRYGAGPSTAPATTR
jgi:prepilin signal peptidase PulO-like enzyme (type II secretory pathway)